MLSRRLIRRGKPMVEAIWALDIPSFRQELPAFAKELRRARRYQHPLTVLVLGSDTLPLTEGRKPHPSLSDLSESVPWEHLLYYLLGSFLRNNLRETDILAAVERLRYVVVMPETSEADARRAVQRLREAYAHCAPYPLRVGLAAFPANGLTIEALVDHASETYQGDALEPLTEPEEVSHA